MKLLVYLSIILSIWGINTAYSQSKRFEPPKPIKWEIGANFGYTTASSYYNLNDSVIVSLKTIDTNNITKFFTFDFYKTTINFKLNYYPFESLMLSIDIPISFYELDEKYFYDNSPVREPKSNNRLTRVDFIGLGVHKKWKDEDYTIGIGSIVCIPSGFHKGLYDDENYKFLSDGALVARFFSEINYKLKQFVLKNYLGYEFRGEEFIDQFVWKPSIGFTSVPNTELNLFSQIILSAKSFNSSIRPFSIYEETPQENNYFGGAEFAILITRNILTKFGYQVSLAGKNSWKKSGAFLEFWYRI